MKKILLTGLFLFMAVVGFSQAANSQYDIYSRTIDINEKGMAFGLTEAQFEAIKEEAYANVNFIPGNIYQTDELVKAGVPMRYNTYADEIEIKKNASVENFSALIRDPDIFVKMGNDIYVFIPFKGSNEKGGYFNILSDGQNYDLYKKTSSVYNEPVKAKTNYQQDVPPSFSKSTKYYLVENGTFLEMPKGKSKIIKMMGPKKNEIKTFIKENKLDIDKEEDLIKLVEYFDSLQ